MCNGSHICCCIRNHPQTQWLKATIYLLIVLQFSQDSTRLVHCSFMWYQLEAVVWLHSARVVMSGVSCHFPGFLSMSSLLQDSRDLFTWWLASTKAQARPPGPVRLDPHWRQCHFCYITLIKVSHKTSSVLRKGEIYSMSWWEEQHQYSEMEGFAGGHLSR